VSAQEDNVASVDDVDVIVLNGVSSSGKSTLARRLQDELAGTWLTFGIDTLIGATSDTANFGLDGLVFVSDGSIHVGPAFRRLEAAWLEGLATMARAGVPLILDEVFLEGATSQERLAGVLDGLRVVWVGVMCDEEVAVSREALRGDRIVGMTERQTTIVHAGVTYDVIVDTTHRAADELAREVARYVEANATS
jgi:chloramphenicol 3-O phosphotransferase